MFWLSKKKAKEEFNKIKNSFKKRDNKIYNNSKVSESLKSQIDENKLKIARLEGIVSTLISQGISINKSQKSQKVLVGPFKSHSGFETKLINKVRRSKKSLIIAEISKLMPSHSVIEIYEIIVKEKGLCSKATFYRYISSLKSQSLIKTETKLKHK